jgi:hypothetical protein
MEALQLNHRLGPSVADFIISDGDRPQCLGTVVFDWMEPAPRTTGLSQPMVGAEAERERLLRISRAPDTGPLVRTLLRLRHDLVMIGRAAAAPLPISLHERLKPLAEVAAALGDFLRASAAALLARHLPPDIDGVESALDSCAAAVATVRDNGLTRCLSTEETERFFALCFGLEQMRHNLRDLHRCVAEWAQSPAPDE